MVKFSFLMTVFQGKNLFQGMDYTTQEVYNHTKRKPLVKQSTTGRKKFSA